MGVVTSRRIFTTALAATVPSARACAHLTDLEGLLTVYERRGRSEALTCGRSSAANNPSPAAAEIVGGQAQEANAP